MADSASHDFRRVATHPTEADLRRETAPELSPNLVDKAYDSSDQYLKTQFQLLREESVRPLIDDVNKLRDILTDEQTKSLAQNGVDSKRKALKDKVEKEVEANVYFDVRLLRDYVEFNSHYGPVLKFTFDHSSLDKIDLTVSYRR